MTPAERPRDPGAALCRRLAERIAEIAPVGLGQADWVWEMVAEPDASFVITLSAWESDPSEEAKARVKEAYNSVLDVWGRAAAEFERQEQEAS